MRSSAILGGLFVVLILGLIFPGGGLAEVVGTLTQVEGRVDLLKSGKLPATPLKVQDGVEPGDVIRTKSLSRAQITFVDNSTLTISPESRIAINEYTLDAARGKRNAVLEIFQGVAMAVVTKIFKTETPDFVVKTHTAVMGVRGTEVGVRLAPNSSTFLDFKGYTSVSNVFPEVKGTVELGPMEGTVVERGLPPTLKFDISKEDRELFIRQLTVLAPSQTLSQKSASTPAGALPAAKGGTTPSSYIPYGSASPLTTAGAPAIISYLPPALTLTQYTFTQTYTGDYVKLSDPPYAIATFNSSNTGSGVRTGVYAGAFSANYSIVATAPQNTFFSVLSSGTITATSSGTVTGPPGGTLTGTMLMQATTTGSTTFNFSGPVTLQPNGNLTYSTLGTFSLMGITGPTTGTWTQKPK